MTKEPPQKITFDDVERARRNFAKTLAAFRKQKGRYHNPAPELAASKLADCALLPNRYALLDKVAKGGVMAEVGVDRGDFSLEIFNRCAPDHLHLFDIDISRLVNPQIRAELARPDARITTHVGDSSAHLGQMPDAHFDMIYIDGDHAYEGVMKDIKAAVPKLKPAGVLIFNDYTVWSASSMYHCGVARAVHEFCQSNPWKFRYMALQTMLYNDVMLVRE
ncbi:class I SAM-dependent methyltransferase [Roseovarius sp. M141]|uniref:class I SAM-dependent methyltransferase n=1 Tax=Roseovarius sp. M141 TaxID=2583806 RepID=UPI0020CE3DF5|nr:class I SAM-dependent methyltransferase [Roseovarius sp. M141]MCQ0090548.1 class I SAM-dependent methyltransferase [Roseovarius sp. M141]